MLCSKVQLMLWSKLERTYLTSLNWTLTIIQKTHLIRDMKREKMINCKTIITMQFHSKTHWLTLYKIHIWIKQMGKTLWWTINNKWWHQIWLQDFLQFNSCQINFLQELSIQQFKQECLNNTIKSHNMSQITKMTTMRMMFTCSSHIIKPNFIRLHITQAISMLAQWIYYIDWENLYGHSVQRAHYLKMKIRSISMAQFGLWSLWLLKLLS